MATLKTTSETVLTNSDAAPQTTTAAPASANLASIGLILLSVLLAGSGQLIFKQGLNTIGELNLSLEMFISIATSPVMIVGLIVYGLSALFWLIALMKADLSFAYPFLSASYIIVLVGGAVLFNETITFARVLGFVVIITGLLIVARSEAKRA